jgi:hypothetical protein
VDNTVSGTVQEEDNTPLGGALVSAQLYNPDAEDLRDEVFVESTTETAPDGTYTLLLPLNTYNIVATATGYLPACKELEAEWYSDNDDADFTLTLADEIRSINVTVAGMATEEDTALLSFRQTQKCGEGDVMIEVASMNVTNGVYPISLPAGTYDVVASAVEKTTQKALGIDLTVDLNFTF